MHEVIKISLAEARNVLFNCDAVLLEDNVVITPDQRTYPYTEEACLVQFEFVWEVPFGESSLGITPEDCIDGEYEFDGEPGFSNECYLSFLEKDNQQVEIAGSVMTLVDEKGRKIPLQVLEHFDVATFLKYPPEVIEKTIKKDGRRRQSIRISFEEAYKALEECSAVMSERGKADVPELEKVEGDKYRKDHLSASFGFTVDCYDEEPEKAWYSGDTRSYCVENLFVDKVTMMGSRITFYDWEGKIVAVHVLRPFDIATRLQAQPEQEED